MYINNNDKNKVLISHLNFFGKRRDFEIAINDIEPFDSIQELNQSLFKLRIKNSDGFMLMTVRFGKILDKPGFLTIFKIK